MSGGVGRLPPGARGSSGSNASLPLSSAGELRVVAQLHKHTSTLDWGRGRSHRVTPEKQSPGGLRRLAGEPVVTRL